MTASVKISNGIGNTIAHLKTDIEALKDITPCDLAISVDYNDDVLQVEIDDLVSKLEAVLAKARAVQADHDHFVCEWHRRQEEAFLAGF